MGVELTQWTLIKPGRPGAPNRQAEGSIWLKSPSGEMQLLPLANLTPAARQIVNELASGSKVPKDLLADLLATRGETDSKIEAAAGRPWTLHHLEPRERAYVYLSPPPERGARPVAFPLVSLPTEMRRELEVLAPGERVSEAIVAALEGSATWDHREARAVAVAGQRSRRQ